ncbi:MAG: DUF86 domain-containing protein [Alphaproteobacteria bacterium]|nr:DUF86 domain-containing protein [Alphaproteobacteria bacterium]
MTAPSRDDDFLHHILQAIERIDTYLQSVDRLQFMADAMMQDAVIRNIEIIGEATRRLSTDLTVANAEVPWREIAGMRNRLAHGYFAINITTVWNVAQKDLPMLRAQIQAILRNRG